MMMFLLLSLLLPTCYCRVHVCVIVNHFATLPPCKVLKKHEVVTTWLSVCRVHNSYGIITVKQKKREILTTKNFTYNCRTLVRPVRSGTDVNMLSLKRLRTEHITKNINHNPKFCFHKHDIHCGFAFIAQSV